MSSIKILSIVASFIVTNDDGSINWKSTLAGLRSKMEEEILANAEKDMHIEAALDSLYDAMPPGSSLPTPTAVQTVAASLAGGNLAEQVRIAADVEEYLKRSPRFVAKRGRSGGLFRIG